MLIAGFMFISSYISDKKWAIDLARTGQMTLTHYVSHLIIGLIIFAFFKSENYSGIIEGRNKVSPLYILLYSSAFFILSILFSKIWVKKFRQRPLEILMRTITN